ncbi:MAG: hypothetical protein ACFFCW_05470 [Candidatus Hodarchaeota archaeon]
MNDNIELRLGKPRFNLNPTKNTNQIQLESNSRIDLNQIGPNWLTDPISLCILGYLFPDRRHTKAQIASQLNLWEHLVVEKLEHLKREGFLHCMSISFGIDPFGRKKSIRIYQLSERGRFLLHQLDTQFPGLFFC